MSTGYSGTPLVKKLGIKKGHRVALRHEPAEFRALLVDLPADVSFIELPTEQPDIVIAFYAEAETLDTELAELADAVFPDNVVWLAWPKKSSGVPSNLTGDVVRAAVLATTLVDVKVCAISETWSGLKVVWRRTHR